MLTLTSFDLHVLVIDADIVFLGDPLNAQSLATAFSKVGCQVCLLLSVRTLKSATGTRIEFQHPL